MIFYFRIQYLSFSSFHFRIFKLWLLTFILITWLNVKFALGLKIIILEPFSSLHRLNPLWRKFCRVILIFFWKHLVYELIMELQYQPGTLPASLLPVSRASTNQMHYGQHKKPSVHFHFAYFHSTNLNTVL